MDKPNQTKLRFLQIATGFHIFASSPRNKEFGRTAAHFHSRQRTTIPLVEAMMAKPRKCAQRRASAQKHRHNVRKDLYISKATRLKVELPLPWIKRRRTKSGLKDRAREGSAWDLWMGCCPPFLCTRCAPAAHFHRKPQERAEAADCRSSPHVYSGTWKFNYQYQYWKAKT